MESFLLDLFPFDAGGGDAARAPMMDASPADRRTAPLLVARFPDAATAERRLGGLSLAARWAARAREAGQALAIFAPGLARWPAATRDDFARIGLEPGIVTSVAAGATVLDARFLPDAAALRAAVRGAPVDRAGALDLADEGAALRVIVRSTAKSTDGIISRRLNRPVSQRVSVLLLRWWPEVRPWHATALVALVAVAMIASLLFGGYPGLIAGGVLFHLASVLDGVDGEIARATHRASAAGAALDTRVDMLTNIGYFVSVAVALTRLYGGAQAAVGGLAVVLALLGLAIVAWLARRMGLHGSLDVLKPYYRERFPEGWQFWVTEVLVATTSRDFFAFAFGVVIVLGLGWTVSWLLLGFVITWLAAVICAVPGVLRQADYRPLTGI
jgi:CDP-L-myo-inositol myo-inositolphosphotransferase